LTRVRDRLNPDAMHTSLCRAARVAALGLLAAMLFTACGTSAIPTVPPATPATPGSSTAPGVDPTPVGGSQAPGALIVALNIQFDPVDVAVPAGEQLTLTFDNRDQGIPHDVVIRDASGNELAKTGIITGPAQAQLVLGPLEPGVYPFACTVHPNMTGQITAK
jgi:plastocyanin